MRKTLAEHTDEELIEALGAKRIIQLSGSVRGRLQTPHAGPGRPTVPTPCPSCGKMQRSVKLAKAHCKR